jgi:kynurenine formamidase
MLYRWNATKPSKGVRLDTVQAGSNSQHHELTSAQVVGYMSELSNWGRWGDDDQLGTLNFISASGIASAAGTVTEGLRISCGRSLSPRAASLSGASFLHHMLSTGREAPAKGVHEAYDWVGMSIHGSAFTHLDSHGHVFWDGKQYNGRGPESVDVLRGAKEGSVEAAKDGIVTRGVLLDLPRCLEKDFLTADDLITPDVLEECEQLQRVQVTEGDALFVRTGRDAASNDAGVSRPTEGIAGLHASCLPWIHSKGVSVLASDGVNDLLPSRIDAMKSPIHIVGIVAMGLWLIDSAYLEDLAITCLRTERWEFLSVVAPLSIKYATGSPVNPVAIF